MGVVETVSGLLAVSQTLLSHGEEGQQVTWEGTILAMNLSGTHHASPQSFQKSRA